MPATAPELPDWTSFEPVAGPLKLSAPVLAETLDGGQAFRWKRESDEVWLGLWAGNVVRLRLDSENRLEWSAPQAIAPAVKAALVPYLSGHDIVANVDSLPWRSDAHLARGLAAFPGLTILRQPFGETLLCFLCSATKQIVQIKQMVDLLARRLGRPLFPPASGSIRGKRSVAVATSALAQSSDPSAAFHRLPTWDELARVEESDLRACLLGFRARYVHQTALFLAANPGWLDQTEHLPYLEAKERLMRLPGVGAKVADCVLLFGAGKLEAFPVDTWIIKAMERRYALDRWAPDQIAHFGRVHFGAAAGLAQQYLFAYERAFGRE